MARPNKPWFRKDIGWWMVTINGEKIRLAEGRRNRQEAQRVFHELMAVRANRPEAGTARTADVVEAFLGYVERHLSSETYRGYHFYCQKFAEAWGYVPARELKPHHVTRWVGAKQWNETTEYNACRSVFRAFSWAWQEGVLLDNPLRGMRRPRPRCRQRCLTDEEYGAIIATAMGSFKTFVRSLRQTGARPSELRQLTWDQVRTDRWVIPVHKTDRKVRRPRIAHLNPAMQQLMKHLRKQSQSTHVFLNSRQPWTRNALRLRMDRIKKKCNLADDVCLYLVRHTYGTEAVLNGVDVATIAELMGHSSLEMVSKVYLHLADQVNHLQDAAKRATQHLDPARHRADVQRRGA